MNEFLRQVSRHYYPSDDLRGICFIFPNKRSGLFFRKYLSETAGRDVFSPRCMTVSDFFLKPAGKRIAGHILQLKYLYDCYVALTGSKEPLDDFLYWGEVILADFSDVDKYLADPKRIFSNVAEFKQYQDDLSYLSDTQRKALEGFIAHFENRGAVKEEFLHIWNILSPLYHDFSEALAGDGLATEGQAYRSLAASLEQRPVLDIMREAFPGIRKFVFVGLNALSTSEEKVLYAMAKAGIADFCWDYCSPEIKDPANRSSFFLGKAIGKLGSAFNAECPARKAAINVLSVSSSVGQAKQIPAILERFGGTPGLDTAIVLPDEGLLLPVLNSLPPLVESVNVTMGYPLKGSAFSALVDDMGALQLNRREDRFYHKQAWGILSNVVFRALLSETGLGISEKIRKEAKYYIPASDFAGDPLMEAVFRPEEDMAAYLKDAVTLMAGMMQDDESMGMELYFAKEWIKAINQLQELRLEVKPATWLRLLGRLSAGISVPFEGEPLQGMQIMGTLETRALDFKNLIILSCNEGLFPHRAVEASFIPPQLRKGFDLPTYEYQDAMWAYYFYRLIQRAENVWLLMDSRTEMSRSGEESRYIKQLEYLYGFQVKRYVMKAKISSGKWNDPLPRTEEHAARMHSPQFRLSASSLQRYLSCQAKFYYADIEKLSPAEEVSESMDSGMNGNALHHTMQQLYGGREYISSDYLKDLLDHPEKVRSVVEEKMRDEIKGGEIGGRNLVYEEMILGYALQIIRTDLKLLGNKRSFRIIGLEEEKQKEIGGFRFRGFIDRIDSFGEGIVRIVDYKTGAVKKEDIAITDANAGSVIANLFGADDSKRPKIALQLYLYDEFMQGDERMQDYGQVQNCIYQTSSLFVEEPMSVPVSQAFVAGMRERLGVLLQELSSPEGEWTRTDNAETCKWCDFKTICGR